MTRSVSFGAALAALSLLSLLAAKPAYAQQVLSPAQIAPDIAVMEAIARRPLLTQERAQVTAINQALFRRDPARTLKALRQEVADIQNVRRMDPVHLTDWPKTSLTNVYFLANAPGGSEVLKAYVATYTR